MLTPDGTRLEVWGDPVAHSRSPQLHTAAYGVLGLDWTLRAPAGAEAAFAGELAGLSAQWRGLSLTMPLKGVAFAAAARRDRRVRAHRRGQHAAARPATAHAASTPTSAASSARSTRRASTASSTRASSAPARRRCRPSSRSASSARAASRSSRAAPRPSTPLAELGAALGIDVVGVGSRQPLSRSPVPVSIATLPGDAPVADAAADALARARRRCCSTSCTATGRPRSRTAWERSGQHAVSGLGMLLHQALLQVRIFVGRRPGRRSARRGRRARGNAPGGHGRLDECSACSRPANRTAPNSSPSWRVCLPASPCRAPRSKPTSPAASSATAAARA